MADRTSARLFAEIFEMLASDEPIDRKSLARFFWNQTHGYDFCSYQMNCDDALVKLGLATCAEEDGRKVISYDGEDY